MGHENLSLSDILKGEGRGHELVRVAFIAVMGAGGNAEDARPLWTEAFQGQIAQVLVGRCKIVDKTPEEIMRTARRPFDERKAAVLLIDDQATLVRLATDLTLEDWLRRAAFCRVQDEGVVAQCAKTLEHGDETDERLLTMNSEKLLYDVAMNAVIAHPAWFAAKRLISVSPKMALRVAVEHVRDNGPGGIDRLGTHIASEAITMNQTTLLQWIIEDDHSHPEVRKAAMGIWPYPPYKPDPEKLTS